MPYFPDIPSGSTQTLFTNAFLGLNKGLSISDGEFANMQNLTADSYPVLTTRQKRAAVTWGAHEDGGKTTFEAPMGMTGTDRLVIIDNGLVYLDGALITGLQLSTEEAMQPKHLVGMGAYVCIWPDKKYLNIHNPEDCGDMGSAWAAESGQEITAVMCRKDGTDYDMTQITVGDTAPEEPEDEQLWLDTSGENDVLKQYSAIYAEWVQVATTYIKLQASGIGKGLKDADVVWIEGAKAAGAEDEVSVAAETSAEFPADGFDLYSSFTTTQQGGSWVSTTATVASRTKVITVSGIPAGARIMSAKLKVATGISMYGAKQLTVNGVKLESGEVNEIDVDVSGNGDVSLLFKFQSYNSATEPGEHGGSISFSDIVLTVTYEEGSTETTAADLSFLNTSNVIYGAGDDYIIVAGLLHEAVALASTLKVELRIPDLDYVCEANNRIWGCCYAKVDGEMLNELRACALGDFRNWYRFEGTSMDSYTASVGTEGVFTGATSLRGSPIFFKENVMHRITGTQPSNFTLTTTMCRGVQDGCWRSLAFVGETLYYKARTDVMMYDGSTPVSVSEKLGQERYYEASAGVYRDKYYLCMQDSKAAWHLFVYDTLKGLWHREDDAEIHHFATVKGDMYFIDEKQSPARLMSINGLGDAVEEAFDWSATFGIYGFDYEGQKYLSRFNIRAQLAQGATMKMEIMYDSDGKWVDHGTMRAKRLMTYLLPIVPRRCDHCQIRLSGKGDMKLYSIARELEGGGDGVGQPQQTGGWNW